MSDLGNTYLSLGTTYKFFMPWFVPRNQKDTVYRGTWLSRLFGRKRRDVHDPYMDFRFKGIFCHKNSNSFKLKFYFFLVKNLENTNLTNLVKSSGVDF